MFYTPTPSIKPCYTHVNSKFAFFRPSERFFALKVSGISAGRKNRGESRPAAQEVTARRRSRAQTPPGCVALSPTPRPLSLAPLCRFFRLCRPFRCPVRSFGSLRLAVVSPSFAPRAVRRRSRPRRSRYLSARPEFFDALAAGAPRRTFPFFAALGCFLVPSHPPCQSLRKARAPQKRLFGFCGHQAEDARQGSALKPPAAVFGLAFI